MRRCIPTRRKAPATPASRALLTLTPTASVVFTEKIAVLRLVAEAAKSATLPKPLRRDVLIAAWTRAILLDQDGATASRNCHLHCTKNSFRKLAPSLAELLPATTGWVNHSVHCRLGGSPQFPDSAPSSPRRLSAAGNLYTWASRASTVG